MCEQVSDLVNNTSYDTANEMLAAGILVTLDDVLDSDRLGLDGLLHGYTDGAGDPVEPFSPFDTCLCGIDTAAALNRTPGLEWQNDEFMGEPEITAWAR